MSDKHQSEKMWQVCKPNECDKIPVMDVEVGNQKHNFCCQKGLEHSLKEFQEFVATKKSRTKRG